MKYLYTMNGKSKIYVLAFVLIGLFTTFSTISFCQTLMDSTAERMLVYQRSIGGWPKFLRDKNNKEVKVDYTKSLSESEKALIKADSLKKDATYDNSATSREIIYLVKAYKETRNVAYLRAAERGIGYILNGQYKTNGGWPQFYPVRSGYPSHITYNDNAMVNCLNILQDVVTQSNNFEVVDKSLIARSQTAVERGVKCILATQIKVKGKLTAWCAQYDTATLQPANARAYELASLSGSESVSIVRFLMRLKNPSSQVRESIACAIDWFNAVKIAGYKYASVDDPSLPKGIDKVLVPEPSSVVWARFYEINTNEPFFVGRDGIKKKAIAEIEHERRIGYAWYGNWPQKLIDKEYPEWLKANTKRKSG